MKNKNQCAWILALSVMIFAQSTFAEVEETPKVSDMSALEPQTQSIDTQSPNSSMMDSADETPSNEESATTSDPTMEPVTQPLMDTSQPKESSDMLDISGDSDAALETSSMPQPAPSTEPEDSAPSDSMSLTEEMTVPAEDPANQDVEATPMTMSASFQALTPEQIAMVPQGGQALFPVIQNSSAGLFMGIEFAKNALDSQNIQDVGQIRAILSKQASETKRLQEWLDENMNNESEILQKKLQALSGNKNKLIKDMMREGSASATPKLHEKFKKLSSNVEELRETLMKENQEIKKPQEIESLFKKLSENKEDLLSYLVDKKLEKLQDKIAKIPNEERVFMGYLMAQKALPATTQDTFAQDILTMKNKGLLGLALDANFRDRTLAQVRSQLEQAAPGLKNDTDMTVTKAIWDTVFENMKNDLKEALSANP